MFSTKLKRKIRVKKQFLLPRNTVYWLFYQRMVEWSMNYEGVNYNSVFQRRVNNRADN